jgi:hypothetical protein
MFLVCYGIILDILIPYRVDIEGIFDPVLRNIEELVLKQMDQLAPLGLFSKASYSVLHAEGTY